MRNARMIWEFTRSAAERLAANGVTGASIHLGSGWGEGLEELARLMGVQVSGTLYVGPVEAKPNVIERAVTTVAGVTIEAVRYRAPKDGDEKRLAVFESGQTGHIVSTPDPALDFSLEAMPTETAPEGFP